MIRTHPMYHWPGKQQQLEPGFYEKQFENDIEVQDIETYITFLVPLDNKKLYLSMRNDSVTLNKI